MRDVSDLCSCSSIGAGANARKQLASLAIGLALVAGACGDSNEEGPPDAAPAPVERTYPSLLVTPDMKSGILARIDREPYTTIYQQIVDRAAREYREQEGEVWDHSAHGQNGLTAEAAALLAWLNDDEEAAAKVRDFFSRLLTNIMTTERWDLNIRMPDIMIGYSHAWDLLAGTDYFPEEEASAAADKLAELAALTYFRYVEDNGMRTLALHVSQNNHPIRTATAIGFAGLVLRDRPEYPAANEWLNWAVSELDYLWGENGQYVQADGGISEGPFYFGFALAPTVAFFIAVENSTAPERQYTRNCINRSDSDPWTNHGCVEGESFTFENPLRLERFHATAAWTIALRLPNGNRPPLADASTRVTNGPAVLTGFGGPGYFRWDWENHEEPMTTTKWHDLTAHHLVYFDDQIAAEEPPWTNRFLPDAGNAVFRSSWDSDAIWMLMVAENGSARKTLHDHVDGTSISLAAYGEYLLIDTGYYKPNSLANSRTAYAPAHSVILIDGQGAPDKGTLTNFGDTDAFLRNSLDEEAFAYSEAHQTYEETDIERSLIFARKRYGVVADRLATEHTGAREHRWRLHGNAGLDAGGTFAVAESLATWERDAAGVEVHLASTAADLQLVEPDYVEFEAPHVHSFDTGVGHHKVLDGAVTATAPGFLAILAPYRTGAETGDLDGHLEVTRVDTATAGQAAWLVTTGAGTDLVWLREPDAAEQLTLADGTTLGTDAQLILLGLDDGATLIARGTELTMNEAVVATAEASDGVATTTASLP